MTFQEKQPYLKLVRWKRMHKRADLNQWYVLSMHDNARTFTRRALNVWPHTEGDVEVPEEEWSSAQSGGAWIALLLWGSRRGSTGARAEDASLLR